MLRAIILLSLVLSLPPAIALAQTGAPPAADSDSAAAPAKGRARGADIRRDEYIQKAVERAKHNAEKRFDKMDANHDGILTADERRAAADERRAARAAKRGASSDQ